MRSTLILHADRRRAVPAVPAVPAVLAARGRALLAGALLVAAGCGARGATPAAPNAPAPAVAPGAAPADPAATSAAAAPAIPMDAVTLVNAVEIAADQQPAFIEYWSNVNAVLKSQPGYIASHLLQSNGTTRLSTGAPAKFSLVAVITFRTEDEFWTAVKLGWERYGLPRFPGVTSNPGLYTRIR